MAKVLVAVLFEAKKDGTIIGTTTKLECDETPKTLKNIQGERKCVGEKSMLRKEELGVIHVPRYAMVNKYWVWGAMYEENDEQFSDKLLNLTNKVMDTFSKEMKERHELCTKWVSAMLLDGAEETITTE